jgi:hypothetical protein
VTQLERELLAAIHQAESFANTLPIGRSGRLSAFIDATMFRQSLRHLRCRHRKPCRYFVLGKPVTLEGVVGERRQREASPGARPSWRRSGMDGRRGGNE